MCIKAEVRTNKGRVDAVTTTAFKAFQRDNQLKPDGRAGPATLRALSITVERRRDQIALAMQRWRESRSLREGRPSYARVNIPSYTMDLFENGPPTETLVARVSELYREADVFHKAAQLVDKYQQRAEDIAENIRPESFRRLLYYLIDTVLYRGNPTLPETPVIEISANAIPQT